MTVRPRVLLFSLLAGLLFLLLVAAFMLEAERLTALLVDRLEQEIGRTIEVGEARFSIFPRLRLDLEQVAVLDPASSEVLFKARRLHLILRSTPLMRLQIVVKRLWVDEPVMTVRRGPTGRWDAFVPLPTQAASETRPFVLFTRLQEVRLRDGDLTLIDEARPDGQRTVRLSGVEATLDSGSDNVVADLHLAATLPMEQGSSSITLNGKILAVGAAPQTNRAVERPLAFEGRIDGLNLNLRQLADVFGPRPVPDRMHGTANVQSQIKFTPGSAGYDLALSRLSARIGHLAVSGQMALSGLFTSQQTLSATFASEPADLDELLNRLPVAWLDPRIEQALADREVGGSIEVVTATVTGTTAPEPHVSVTGELNVRDGHALLGAKRTPARQLSGTVILEAGRVKFSRIRGEYGALRITDGLVLLTLDADVPRVTLDVSGEMAAGDLSALLISTMPPSRFTRALGSLTDVHGASVVTFRLAGPLNDPGGPSFVGGEIAAQGIGFTSPSVPEPISDVTGHVAFSPELVELDRLNGHIGHSHFEFHGGIQLGQGPAYKGFSAQLSAEPALLRSLTDLDLVRQIGLQGQAGVQLALDGPLATPRIRATVDFHEAALRVQDYLDKPAGHPATVIIDAKFTEPLAVKVERLEATVPPLQVTGKGKLRLGRRFSIDAGFTTGSVSIADLPKGLVFGGIEGGVVEITMDVKGKGPQWTAWNFNGWIALTDGRISLKHFPAPLTNVYLRSRLQGASLDVKRLSFTTKNSDLTLSGLLTNWKVKPEVTFKADAKRFDLALLVPEGGRSPVRDFLEDFAASGHMTGTLRIAQGHYKGFPVNDLSAQIAIHDRALTVDPFTGMSDKGAIAARVALKLPQHKPLEADVSWRLTDYPIDRFFLHKGHETRPLSGTLKARADLTFTERHQGAIAGTLNGRVTVGIADGVIRKGTAIPKILKIMNLPTLLQGKVNLSEDGLPFDTITGTGTITNGRLTTQDFVVDSPVLKISGAGSYDIPSDQLDMVMAASPLGSYSKLIQSIPLFGKLFAGERHGITTALFEVKGPWADPQTRYMPFKSLATGLTGYPQLAIDILKNTLLLPKELLSPSEPPASDGGTHPSSPLPPPASAAP